MIFVDEVGGVFPQIGHSPWNNFTLADFVMPWFLFMVGVSMAFSFKKFLKDKKSKWKGIKFAFKRSIKLYLLGVVL